MPDVDRRHSPHGCRKLVRLIGRSFGSRWEVLRAATNVSGSSRTRRALLRSRDSGRQTATPPSCGRLVLSALVLAAERIAASGPGRRPRGPFVAGSPSTLGGAGSQTRAASESQNGRSCEHRWQTRGSGELQAPGIRARGTRFALGAVLSPNSVPMPKRGCDDCSACVPAERGDQILSCCAREVSSVETSGKAVAFAD